MMWGVEPRYCIARRASVSPGLPETPARDEQRACPVRARTTTALLAKRPALRRRAMIGAASPMPSSRKSRARRAPLRVVLFCPKV
jgi:hypothetical protein